MTEAEIKDLFTYEMTTKFLLVKEAIVAAALAINEHCPPGADRTAAMRKLKEAHMTANASIVLEGKSYR